MLSTKEQIRIHAVIRALDDLKESIDLDNPLHDYALEWIEILEFYCNAQ
jgi:hypothetical protein